MGDALTQIVLLGVEAVFVAVALLAFFRLRSHFGLALLYVTLGGFQYLQTVLATAVYIEILPGILVSPGSSVLFTATLFAVLLVYVREDADEARSLIYGIVVANIVLTAVLMIIGLHLSSPRTALLNEFPPAVLDVNVRLFMVGTLALVVDTLLIIVLYEAVSRYVTQRLFLRILFSMLVVVTVDTLLFGVGGFAGTPMMSNVISAGLLGKVSMSFVYSAVLALYLKQFEHVDLQGDSEPAAIRDIFQALTYRQRYHLLREELVRDPLTGIYNRGFFDDALPRELERASRAGHATCLMLVDLDHFKRINDDYGHLEGDRVLRALADSLTETLRTADLPCRYGGEEFAVVLPDTGLAQAREVAERVRADFAAHLARLSPALAVPNVTMTIGIAAFPDEAGDATQLIATADARLYAGKTAGRDRVVAGKSPA